MKALAIRRYKAPMEMMELPRPEPGTGELLVRVRAASVSPPITTELPRISRATSRARSRSPGS
jgi:Zn-dependent alcohol dehydrogenase